jgi:hypothetical protein
MDKHARPKLTHGFAQALFDNRYMIRALYIIMQIDILFEQIKGALKR